MAQQLAESEARSHIRDIRHKRGVENGVKPLENWNLQDLRATLKILSQELYSKETHFLFELIQNADDNTFNVETPFLHLRLFPGHLESECNEVGFTRDQVESLCRIGASTKGKNKKGAIGEKGIGFKSVFKIAYLARIQSGAYSFKFDTRPPLLDSGMIVPTWVRPQQGAWNFQGTLLTLELKPRFEVRELQSDLQTLDPAFLLFLRNLRQLKFVSYIDQSSILLQEAVCERTENEEGETARIRVRVAHSRWTSTEYVCIKRMVSAMPEEEKRADISESQIILAFPLVCGKPQIEDQYTFSFLPIAHFGFKFLIHADFLLTASREDIDYSSRWNCFLRDELASAFRDAILDRFVRSTDPDLSFGWPQYLACPYTMPDSFLDSTAGEIVDLLSEEAFIHSERGKFVKPAKLMILPKSYRWANGDLVLDRGNLPRIALSRKYPITSLRGLRILGVKDMNFTDFVCAFKSLLNEDEGDYFHQKSQKWHSKVAKILLEGIRQEYGAYATAADWLDCGSHPIIPLRNGKWASINSGNLFIEGTGIDIVQSVPRGIESLIKIVDQEAASDQHRRELFLSLGVQKCGKDQICGLILKAHSISNLPNWSTEDCISHAVYLFKAGHHPQGSDQIIFVNASGALIRKAALYLDTGMLGCSINRLFPPDCTIVDRLNSAYSARVPDRRQNLWFKWLLLWPNIHDNPPMVVDGRLSPHFKYILREHGSKVLLKFLKDNFNRYESHFRGSGSGTITHEVGSLFVSADDGGRSRLRDTALPLLRNKSGGCLPILDLQDPGGSGWDFLRIFGVLTRADLQFFIRRLRSMKEKEASPSESEIRPIYESLGSQAQKDPGLLSESFEFDDLIYTESHGWTEPSKCVWTSSFPCSVVPVLSKAYKDCKALFKTYLKVKNADIHTLTAELLDLDPYEQGVAKVKSLLFALDHFLIGSRIPKAKIGDLMSKDVFPIRYKSAIKEADYYSANDWFWIPDRPALFHSFTDRMPLLDLDVRSNELENLRRVLEAFDLTPFLLSHAVEEERVLEGDPSYEKGFTKHLRAKARFVISLMIHQKSLPQQIARVGQQLENLKVFGVSSVKLLQKVRGGSGKDKVIYNGRDSDGRAVLRESHDGLEIYLKQADIHSSQVNYVLIERLGEHCGFDDGGMTLFTLVMNMNDSLEIEEMLEAKGVRCFGQETLFTEQTRSLDGAARNEPPSDEVLEAFSDDIHATVRLDIRHSHSYSISPAVEQAAISELSPRRASHAVADITPLHSSQLSSNLATPARNPNPALPFRPSNGTALPTPSPSPSSSPRVEQTLLSLQDFAGAFTAADMTLTFPDGRTLQHEQNTTFQAQSGDAIPVNFGWSSQRPSFEFSSNHNRSQPSSLASEQQESVASPETPPQRSADQTRQQSYNIFDISDNGDALPFTPTPSFPYPLPVAGEEANLHTKSRDREGGGLFSTSTSLLARPIQSRHAGMRSMDDLDNLIATPGRHIQSAQHSNHEIGLYGEMSVFLYFKQLLAPSFTEENWTSNYRSKATGSQFHGLEKDYADFTFQDTTDGKLAKYLCTCGFREAKNWTQHRPTYHLEVKTTTGSRNEVFFMSNNQVNKARQYTVKTSPDAMPNDIYIVIRVFNLNTVTKKGSMHFYVDPWRLYMEEKVRLEARDCFAVSWTG